MIRASGHLETPAATSAGTILGTNTHIHTHTQKKWIILCTHPQTKHPAG